jgi:hypothetical protein
VVPAFPSGQLLAGMTLTLHFKRWNWY